MMDDYMTTPISNAKYIKSGELKIFSKEVFDFVNFYNSNGYLITGDAPYKYFSSKRLIVISSCKIEKHGAIDYIFGYGNIYIMQYSSINETYCAYVKYTKTPSVIYVEPDVTIDLGKQSLPKLTLHEPNSQHSWGFDYLRCKEAFDYILHNKSIDELPEIVVGVIDDGVESVGSVLGNRLLAAHSFVGDSSQAQISNMGHGAKVCSVLMENTLENVKVVSYKIFSERETALAILRLAEIQAELDGVDIVNSSYGMFVKFESRLQKPLHIASAGNVKCNVPQYPAACDGVVSVAGITKDGMLSETSTFGDWVNVAAPSESIKLPSIYGVDEYGDFSGTSCATSFVTSVCAMIKTQYPDLNNQQIKEVLYSSCNKGNIPVKHGIVNMFNAVTYLDGRNTKEIDFSRADKELIMV